MKKTILFIAAAIIVFCLVPIATTQAMPQEVESQSSIVSQPSNAIVPIFESRKVITELGNPLLKDNSITHDIQQLRTTTIARGGSRPVGNRNPYVKRTGNGRSTMGDDYVEEDGGEEDENDEDDYYDEEDEDEEFDDDSAVRYDSDL